MPSFLSNRKLFGWFIEGLIATFRIVEHFGEPGHNAIGHGFHVDFAAEQLLHRSHRLAFARNDEIEKAQISIHVQSEAVRRDPPREVCTPVSPGIRNASISKSPMARIRTSSRSRTKR